MSITTGTNTGQATNTLADIAANSGTTGVSKSSTGSSIENIGADTVNSNFEMFISLLTTQLKNQDPTNPMDADKFTQQLVQYSGIEQQIKSNSLLTDMMGQLSANSMMSVLGFMNTEITAGGPTSTLKDGAATWTLDSPSTSTLTGHVTIKNDKGTIVSALDTTLKPGAQTFQWNGKDENGKALPEGNYTISVEAKDASGSIVNVGTQTKGVVSGIDFSGSAPILLVGDKRLHISDITSIHTPTTH